MSNSRAIAAVTATLRSLIERGFDPNKDPSADPTVAGTSVTMQPPDEARSANPPPERQLNLYLYQVMPNAAYRNADVPRQLRPGETGQPPLALNLYYLLTAYAVDDAQPISHRILGRAMAVLNDHPVLGRREIETALPGTGLGDQFERIRLSLQPLALEDIFKLWSGFQTHYRLSAAYEATVVLIESSRPVSTPAPVLQRGPDDAGNPSTAGVSLPSIREIRLPRGKGSATLGDELLIVGQNLDGVDSVRFTLINPRSNSVPPIVLLPPAVEPTRDGIKVTLPNDAAAAAAWAAGFYTVAVVVTRNQQTWSSKEPVTLAIAPSIENVAPANSVARNAQGDVTIAITCKPNVRLTRVDDTHSRFDQQVFLLLGTSRKITPAAPPAHAPPPAQPPASTDQLVFTFHVDPNEVGEYLMRLRIDGVDSVPLDPASDVPKFADDQKLEVT
jgi:Pvc16 N-terminal domain